MSWGQIRGWSGGDVHKVYDQAVEEAKDGDILVEVGVAYGRSLAYLARRALDVKKKVRIFGVDTWPESEEAYGGPENNSLVKEAGGYYEACCLEMMTHAPEEYRNVHLLRLSSQIAAEKIVGAVKFVFIDADHDYASVKADIEAWWPRVKESGGVIAGHDMTGSFPGVERAVREIFGSSFEQIDACWRVRA
jgi:cephalosporin hydroxylase